MNNNNSVFSLTFAYASNIISSYDEMIKVLTDGLLQFPSVDEFIYPCDKCCDDDCASCCNCYRTTKWIQYREYVSEKTYIAKGDIWKKIIDDTVERPDIVKNILDFPYNGKSDLEDGKLYKLIYNFTDPNTLNYWTLEEITEKDLI
jgi:hypothetical protein